MYCGAPLVRGATDPGFRPSQAPGADSLVGTVISGRFRVEDLIGQGGMGKVYRARHLALERTVVLKMLKPQLLEDPTLVGRFEREAKAASRLNHPNVIQVLDFGRLENDGTLYIVMEHVQGKDLRLVLRDDWPLAEERLCNILAQVCSALGEAHVNNVIHRDLKPENVMVEARRDQPDHVKVLDFGIAKILDAEMPRLTRHGAVLVLDSGTQKGLTRHDVVCGTPQYMAPEQATGTALDERCDLYALGVILYQMSTGHLPFDGANSMEVLTRHVNEAPVPPRQRQPDAPISEAMERLILRALQKDPAKRPQTAEQFRDELLAVPEQARAASRASTPTRSSTPVPASAPAQPPRTNRVLWIAAAATAALLVLGVTAAMRRPALRGVALETNRAAGQRDQGLARALVAQAREREGAGNLAAARDLLEAALAADANDAEAHYRLADLLLATDPARARAEFDTSRKLDPVRYGDSVARILKDLP